MKKLLIDATSPDDETLNMIIDAEGDVLDITLILADACCKLANRINIEPKRFVTIIETVLQWMEEQDENEKGKVRDENTID